MPLEIEAKMKVEGHEMVRRRLRDAQGELAGRVEETNIFFDSPDQRLMNKRAGLRIRVNRAADGSQTVIITHKGPRIAGALKQREETELTVADAQDAEQLLAKLGFQRQFSFEKRRETWTLDQCKVELDTLPRLGAFVEIEGPSQDAVMAVRLKLGMDGEPLLTGAYVGMLVDDLRRHHIDSAHIAFAASE